MSQIIPRTDAIESIINTRNKFLFGSDVHVGDEFSGWEDTYGHHYYGYCRALHYDGKYLFVLYRQNGDISAVAKSKEQVAADERRKAKEGLEQELLGKR